MAMTELPRDCPGCVGAGDSAVTLCSVCVWGGYSMSSEGLVKWGQGCWSHPYCVQGSGTGEGGLLETRASRMERVNVDYTNTGSKMQKLSEYPHVLTWNRWAPCRRVAGLSGATGLSVLQKWMLDSSGLGVSNRVGV